MTQVRRVGDKNQLSWIFSTDYCVLFVCSGVVQQLGIAVAALRK
jgi:hypothetical protein